MHAISSYRGNRPTNKQTGAISAQCNSTNGSSSSSSATNVRYMNTAREIQRRRHVLLSAEEPVDAAAGKVVVPGDLDHRPPAACSASLRSAVFMAPAVAGVGAQLAGGG